MFHYSINHETIDKKIINQYSGFEVYLIKVKSFATPSRVKSYLIHEQDNVRCLLISSIVGTTNI